MSAFSRRLRVVKTSSGQHCLTYLARSLEVRGRRRVLLGHRVRFPGVRTKNKRPRLRERLVSRFQVLRNCIPDLYQVLLEALNPLGILHKATCARVSQRASACGTPSCLASFWTWFPSRSKSHGVKAKAFAGDTHVLWDGTGLAQEPSPCRCSCALRFIL